MIQRIQTVYLLLSIVCLVLCLCNPVGTITATDGASATMYNLWLSLTNPVTGTVDHVVMPWAALFGLLVLTATLQTVAIFLFKQRALQMRTVNLSMLFLIGYYIAAVTFLFISKYEDQSLLSAYHPTIWAALPLVALVFSYLAFRGILKDHLLVKSLDRLR